MRMTERGLLALARHEGIVPAPYLDVKRVWTFGVGHTAAAGAPDPARMPRGMPADLDAGIAQAFRLFRTDLARYEAGGAARRTSAARAARVRCAGLVPLQHRRDRAGGADPGAQCRRPRAAGAAFMNWLRPASLRPRREAERDLFLHGRYPEGPIPVWAADAGGRVDFRGRCAGSARPRRWRCCGRACRRARAARSRPLPAERLARRAARLPHRRLPTELIPCATCCRHP